MPSRTRHPPPDAAEITMERFSARRDKLLDVLRQVYGYVPPEVAFAIHECIIGTARDHRDYVYLANTRPGTPPDPDRAHDRRAPDRRADRDRDASEEDTVPGIFGRKKR